MQFNINLSSYISCLELAGLNKVLPMAAAISFLMCSVEIHASEPSTINELFGQSNLLDQSKEYLSSFAEVSDVIVLLGDIETGLKNYRKTKEHYEKALRVLKKDFQMLGFNLQKDVGSTDLALLYVKIAINMQRMNEKGPEQFYKLAVRENQLRLRRCPH